MVFNISSCHSQNSTSTITSHITHSPSPPPPPLAAGGRALDRHNPLITAPKRTGIKSLLPEPKPKPKPEPKTKTNATKAGTCNVSRPGVDYISPLESSSRYLLDDDIYNNILVDDVISDDNNNNNNNNNNNSNNISASVGVSKSVEVAEVRGCNKPLSSASVGSSDQVVLLRVSLHCRACERKLKKHLSTMPGVTSFDIDFGAKKVRVVGEVTPSQVLSSISKVKSAMFWSTTVTVPPSSHFSTKLQQLPTK